MDIQRLKWASLAGLLLVLLVLEFARAPLEPYLQSWPGRLVWAGVVALAVLFLVGAVFAALTQTQERLEQRNRELLALDQAGFKARFRGAPMFRTKRRGVLRNVCVALGNIGDRASLPALSRAAEDPEPLIAEHALWAIQQINQREEKTQNPKREIRNKPE